MKFNLIEKTAFSAVFIIFLFCVVRDYTVSHDFLITGVYGFIIGLPLVFICGLYVLIKTLVGSSDLYLSRYLTNQKISTVLPLKRNMIILW